jgi:LacI family transcriptional regulator
MSEVSPRSSQRVLLGDFSDEWGQAAAERLLTEPMPDAVLCGDDVVALARHSVRRGACEVPQDVLVTGYDDIRFTSLSGPGLTTVRQPMAEIGAESVRLLLSRLARIDAPVQHRVLSLDPEHPRLVPATVTGPHALASRPPSCPGGCCIGPPPCRRARPVRRRRRTGVCL